MISQMPSLRNTASLMLIACISFSTNAATFEELNGVFGIPVWADDNLWDDEAPVAAQRLGWEQESATSTDSSFRKYPDASDRVLGVRAYSLCLYGEHDNVSRVSMMFANKGDSVTVNAFAGDAKAARQFRKQSQNYKAAIREDSTKIANALTGLLGAPVDQRLGQDSQTRESAKRWDWNGHAILLISPRDEYATVRIIPLDAPDFEGKTRISDEDLRARLASRVERRPNGDVVLEDLPMVDQGPKGYCVPATWERAMRYMGIPIDMYMLAMAADTYAGGGTSLAGIVAGAREAIRRGGRRLDDELSKVTMNYVQKYIDRGLPIMWSMYSMSDVNAALASRMSERSTMTDPKEWEKTLGPIRRGAKRIKIDRDQAHLCMIIGYNKDTHEIAVSDSWGPAFAERWMTEEEANAVSRGSMMIINL